MQPVSFPETVFSNLACIVVCHNLANGMSYLDDKRIAPQWRATLHAHRDVWFPHLEQFVSGCVSLCKRHTNDNPGYTQCNSLVKATKELVCCQEKRHCQAIGCGMSKNRKNSLPFTSKQCQMSYMSKLHIRVEYPFSLLQHNYTELKPFGEENWIFIYLQGALHAKIAITGPEFDLYHPPVSTTQITQYFKLNSVFGLLINVHKFKLSDLCKMGIVLQLLDSDHVGCKRISHPTLGLEYMSVKFKAFANERRRDSVIVYCFKRPSWYIVTSSELQMTYSLCSMCYNIKSEISFSFQLLKNTLMTYKETSGFYTTQPRFSSSGLAVKREKLHFLTYFLLAQKYENIEIYASSMTIFLISQLQKPQVTKFLTKSETFLQESFACIVFLSKLDDKRFFIFYDYSFRYKFVNATIHRLHLKHDAQVFQMPAHICESRTSKGLATPHTQCVLEVRTQHHPAIHFEVSHFMYSGWQTFSCMYGGLSYFERRHNTFSLEEILTFCKSSDTYNHKNRDDLPTTNTGYRQENITDNRESMNTTCLQKSYTSSQNSILFVFHTEASLNDSGEVNIRLNPSKCEGIFVNPCFEISRPDQFSHKHLNHRTPHLHQGCSASDQCTVIQFGFDLLFETKISEMADFSFIKSECASLYSFLPSSQETERLDIDSVDIDINVTVDAMRYMHTKKRTTGLWVPHDEFFIHLSKYTKIYKKSEQLSDCQYANASDNQYTPSYRCAENIRYATFYLSDSVDADKSHFLSEFDRGMVVLQNSAERWSSSDIMSGEAFYQFSFRMTKSYDTKAGRERLTLKLKAFSSSIIAIKMTCIQTTKQLIITQSIPITTRVCLSAEDVLLYGSVLEISFSPATTVRNEHIGWLYVLNILCAGSDWLNRYKHENKIRGETKNFQTSHPLDRIGQQLDACKDKSTNVFVFWKSDLISSFWVLHTKPLFVSHPGKPFMAVFKGFHNKEFADRAVGTMSFGWITPMKARNPNIKGRFFDGSYIPKYQYILKRHYWEGFVPALRKGFLTFQHKFLYKSGNLLNRTPQELVLTSWFEANKTCIESGGTLPSITSYSDVLEIIDYMRNISWSGQHYRVYIGFHRKVPSTWFLQILDKPPKSAED